MPNKPLRVVVRIKAKPDRVDEVRCLLTGLVAPSREEPGCISYELLQNMDDPADFTFVEEWESESAFRIHSASSHIRAIGPKLTGLVSGAPEIKVYRNIC